MIKIVPLLEKVVQVKLAMVNISPAPAILATNTPAPARATPAALALLAAENIPPALAPPAMNGKMVLVFHLVQYAKLAICITATTPALLTKSAVRPHLEWLFIPTAHQAEDGLSAPNLSPPPLDLDQVHFALVVLICPATLLLLTIFKLVVIIRI